MSLVASQDLGDLGVSNTAPVVVDWRWYHHIPSLGVWIVLVALLLLVPANRCAPAWLILLPVFAVQLGWSMLARLLSLPVEATENVGAVLGALAGAWAAVWLVAPWLARRGVPVGLVSALVLMSVVGGVYGFNAYDVGFIDQARFAIIAFFIGSVLLLSSTVLAALSYRRWFPPERFLAWSLLWTFGMTLLLATLLFGGPVMGAGLALGGGVLDRAFMLFVSLVFLNFRSDRCNDCDLCRRLCRYQGLGHRGGDDQRCIRCLDCTRCTAVTLSHGFQRDEKEAG